MERAFKIIHYNVNPPLAPPKRGLQVFPSWEGLGVGNELAYGHEKLLPKFTKNLECSQLNWLE